MENDLKNYIDKLVAECLNHEVFNSLDEDAKKTKTKEIKRFLQLLIFQSLIDNLAPHQLEELNTLDFSDPNTDTKVAEMSASIPNFGLLVQAELEQAVKNIQDTGEIPETFHIEPV